MKAGDKTRTQLRDELRQVARDLRELHDPGVKRNLIERRRELREQLDVLGPYVGRKCHECERTRPDEETTLVSGLIGGDYRRAPRRGDVRVCLDCTVDHIDYARNGQKRGANTPIDTGRIAWSQAARAFGVTITGLRVSQMSDSVAS